MKFGNLQLDMKPGDKLHIGETEITCLPKDGHPWMLRLHIRAPLRQYIELVKRSGKAKDAKKF